jgi:hypothetical protein
MHEYKGTKMKANNNSDPASQRARDLANARASNAKPPIRQTPPIPVPTGLKPLSGPWVAPREVPLTGRSGLSRIPSDHIGTKGK